ncbi:hypothetical protein BP5796_00468 [Coleophoma crateriformis]|uniref:2EXR domain-containing protein n=1 Tax=Coleophoma crateriformis TaxID=565419 RepID=A0A3D8T853_9HELO|nr:hypothetical protein BP5796_00468 [Coleophoma crateriformis]
MARSFTLFPRLPPELRRLVWQFCLPAPRTIFMKNTRVASRSLSCRRRKVICVPSTRCPDIILLLLHLCVESRAATFAEYEVLFACRSNRDQYYRQHFFAPARDSIFIEDVRFPARSRMPQHIWPWHQNIKPSAAIYHVRKLAIGCNAWWNLWKRDDTRRYLLGEGGLLMFKKLEELHIVFRIVTGHDWDAGWRSDDLNWPLPDVNIQPEPIKKVFETMGKKHAEWKVPGLKLVAWGKLAAT